MTHLNFHQKAIVLNAEGKFLALKATYKGFQWDIPGGKVELPEETETALRREIHEETGLEVEALKPVFVSSAYNKADDFYVLAIMYTCTAVSDVVRLSEEHSEYAWVTRDEFVALDAIPYLKDYVSSINFS